MSIEMPAGQLPVLRIVAGSREAVRLAEQAAWRFAGRLDVTVSLAGIALPPRGCRVDAIGPSTPGLERTAALLEALDPFAREAVRSVREAAQRAGVPRLVFRPPVWHRHPLDRWIEVRDLAGAAKAVPAVARTVLLALPERDLAAFEPLAGLHFPVRLQRRPAHWDRPAVFTPLHCPPPSCREAEIRLLRRTGARAVVMRATGAEQDAPLVLAARALDLPVVMIRRPVERGEAPARSAEAALDWVAARLGGFSPAGRDVPAWR